GRPAVVHVLEVAGAVDEDDGSAVRLRADVGGPVDAGGHLDAVTGGEADDLGRDPVVRPPGLCRRGGDAPGLGAGPVVGDVQLGRLVGVRSQDREAAAVG